MLPCAAMCCHLHSYESPRLHCLSLDSEAHTPGGSSYVSFTEHSPLFIINNKEEKSTSKSALVLILVFLMTHPSKMSE